MFSQSVHWVRHDVDQDDNERCIILAPGPGMYLWKGGDLSKQKILPRVKFSDPKSPNTLTVEYGGDIRYENAFFGPRVWTFLILG